MQNTKNLPQRQGMPLRQLRESFKKYGRSAQTDRDLLTLIIGEESARGLLKYANGSLAQIRRMNLRELCRISGVGEAKASLLLAALELGRRSEPKAQRPKITCSEDVYLLLQEELTSLPHEEFWLLMLNRSNHVIGKYQVSKGGVSGTIADPKLIFKEAINATASAIILAHNHPSNNKRPSQADIQLTKKLKKGGDLLEISVLDHLIFTDEGFFSFNDDGIM